MRPAAISSLAHRTAVTSGSAAIVSPCSYPERALQSPRATGGTTRPAPRSVAAHVSARIWAGLESAGPARWCTVLCPSSSRCATAAMVPATWSAPTAGWWPTKRESETTTGTRGGRASAVGVASSARMMTSPSMDWWVRRWTAALTSADDGVSTSTSVTV